jgi:uncharacterized circularly permuted ATP-grasp superfamily protein/uncharacterized alpha-E superfamily protein
MNNPVLEESDAFDYPRTENGYDEVYGGQPEMRSHWHEVMQGLKILGAQGIQERQFKAERILRDDGATYNAANSILSNRWQLDPIPILLESEEWGAIESGLLERSELFNLILKDLYGERELIRLGIVPPELLFSHSGFLRPCQGVFLPGEHQLILHAVDMVRGQDGTMRIVSDRTQAPSGAGYALENRTVMSRVLPSLFRDSHVHRLSLFFQTLRFKLNKLASNITSEQPRVVILTPGSYSETYFEHAYLANYLGYPLVQGSDLRVSNGYLWMRSLGELERVDVILRRIDDFFADPVELKGDSTLGVPGLLEVVRAGRVIVANPLGSGVLENPALLRYLPAISSHFLGREPRLASVPTYWCGNPQDMSYVLENLDKLVIKSTFRKRGTESIFGSTLDNQQKIILKDQLTKSPFSYVAQEYISPSTAPAWARGQVIPRPAVLRSFSVASESSYRIMPGGLTRVGLEENSLSLTNQLGAVSKDTWIIASEPEIQISLHEDNAWAQPAYSQAQAAFPCRVVENLFWMGRYADRAEAALRLLRTVFVQFNSTFHMPEQTRELLLKTVTEVTTTYPGFSFAEKGLYSQPESELLSVILDQERSGSVSNNIYAMIGCADQVRELLSADTQRAINDLRDQLGDLSDDLKPELNAAPEEALDPLVTTLLALSGLWNESMVRGLGWRFMDIGRRVEKALQAVRLLRSTLVHVLPESEQFRVLEAVLLSSETLITYRRRYHSDTDVAHGLELLLHDGSNPRSVFYQVERLRQHLSELPTKVHGPGLAEEDRYLLEAYSMIQLSSLTELVKEDDKTHTRPALDQLLSRLQYLLQETSTQLSAKYFDQVKVHQPLLVIDWEEEL